MAAKTKPRNRDLPTLTPDQLDSARALYMRRGSSAAWVASELGVTVQSVKGAAKREGWDWDRDLRKDARNAREKPDAAHQAELEAEQDERHAAIAKRELELREALVEKAATAVGTMTAKEALSALRSVGDAKGLQFVERMARGRTTDKTETAGSDLVLLRAVLDDVCPDDGDDAGPCGTGGAAPSKA